MAPKSDFEDNSQPINPFIMDKSLRVYGIDGLRVVGSSTMPKIVKDNTNAPTIMIAERASDMIKEEWLSGKI
ncbi:unnamed protein product [Heterotrigona itama]|uniref:Glucose-methanol-choline oxidoreductase C-terminal domain-containing protein n=1 Tax=Heterotrigona itama TaxID=395501 RepID=A0A6V7H8I2_9HYME|nr:unnamed protein product [Heterotrigona itama]